MKKLIIVSAFIAASNFTQAQNAEPAVQWGKEIENPQPGKSNLTQIFKSDAEGTFAIREQGPYTDHHYLLEKYDASFNRVFSTDITPPVGVMGNSNLVNKVLGVKGKVLVMCDGWNKADKTGSCNIFEVSLDGDVAKTPIVADKATAEKQMKSASFFYDVSDDGTKLITFAQLPYEKDATEKGRLKCFETSSMKELWSNDIDFGVPADKSPDNTIIVANNGDAYLLKKVKMDKNVWKYAMYSFTNGTMKKDEVEIPDKVFNSSKMVINTKGDLVVYGTYATGRWTGNESQGSVYLRVDGVSKTIAAKKVEPWAPELIKAFMESKIGGKAGSVIPMEFKYMIPKSDGSVIAMFEDNKMDKTAVPGSTSFQYNYTYTSGSIMVLCLNPDGTQAWNNVIPKFQETKTASETRLFDSFCYGMLGDRLLVFYGNTNVEYKWKDGSGREYYKETIFGKRVVNPTCLVMIDGKGTMKGVDYYYGWKEKTGLPLLKFMDGASFEMSLNPATFYQAEDGIIIYAEMPGQQRYKIGELKL